MVLLVVGILSETSYSGYKEQNIKSTIKDISYDNDSVKCFYIDNNGIKSYLTCVQVESQTVLK